TQSHSATANGQARMQRHSGSLQAIGLSKYYGRRQVVKDVSMKVIMARAVGSLVPKEEGKLASLPLFLGPTQSKLAAMQLYTTLLPPWLFTIARAWGCLICPKMLLCFAVSM